MRTLVCIVAAVLLAGCPSVSSELPTAVADEMDGGGSGAHAPTIRCTADEECVAVGATCCACPSFATHVEELGAAACNDVDCPTQDACPANTRAACQDGACVLACAPLSCSNTCDAGYARDANGCLTCECATPASDCSANDQCVQIAADCCGCTRGGADTAVRAGTEGAYRDMLGCQSDAQCPGVDACQPGDAPACVQGTCALVQPLPTGACGRPDLPACASCTVNSNDQADMHGVGVCATP